MFNIIPIVLILFSLGIIIVVVVRKFSVLANLNVDTIPAEKEAKVREQIISNRLKRNFFKYYKKASKIAVPAARGIAEISKSSYNKLLEYKEKQKQAEELEAGPEEDAMARRFSEIEEFMKKEDWAEAEKKCIEVIGLDPANIQAFRLLGKVYEEKKEYGEAAQTLEHALRLLEKDYKEEIKGGGDDRGGQLAQIYYDLADIARQEERQMDVLRYIGSALKIEPNNPRFLDIKLQFSIIVNDKVQALEALDTLKKVNPDNQKLAEYEEKVKNL